MSSFVVRWSKFTARLPMLVVRFDPLPGGTEIQRFPQADSGAPAWLPALFGRSQGHQAMAVELQMQVILAAQMLDLDHLGRTLRVGDELDMLGAGAHGDRLVR